MATTPCFIEKSIIYIPCQGLVRVGGNLTVLTYDPNSKLSKVNKVETIYMDARLKKL